MLLALLVDNLGSTRKNATLAISNDLGTTWDSRIINLGETGSASNIATIENRIVVVGEIERANGPIRGVVNEDGSIPDNANPSRPLAASWFSDDFGVSWMRAEVEPGTSQLPNSMMYAVVNGPNGLVASGRLTSLEGPGTLYETNSEVPEVRLDGNIDRAYWFSADGTSWRSVDPAPTPGHFEWTAALIAHDEGVLGLVDRISSTEQSSAAVSVQPGTVAIPLPTTTVLSLSTIDGRSILIGGQEQTIFDDEITTADPVAIWIAG